MPIFYKTIINLKFNKQLNNQGIVLCTRTETVTATGNTARDAEQAALLQAALFVTNEPNEKINYELQTLKIKSKRFF